MNKPLLCIAIAGLLPVSTTGAQSAPAATAKAVHIRGTIQSMSAGALTVKTATGVVRVQLTPPLKVLMLVPSDRAHIKDHTFVGITSVPRPDGTQRAVEVHIFPESMRGAGEGTRPWDLPGAKPGGSKMTNGTAHPVLARSAGHSKMTNGTVSRRVGDATLTVQYKDGTKMGAQTITIPSGIPIVTFVPGQLADLKPGAHVFVLATRDTHGGLTASRVQVGKNGLVPPM